MCLMELSELHSLAFFQLRLFSAVSFHTSSDIPQHRLCLVPALKAYSPLVQETQAPCSYEYTLEQRAASPGIKQFHKSWGFFCPLHVLCFPTKEAG